MLFFALGCKKDDIKYPSAFYAEKLVVKSETRMFNHEGEITDPTVIADYIKNVDYFRAEDAQKDAGTHMVTLKSSSQAEFGLNQSVREFNYKKVGNQFLFNSVVMILDVPNQTDFKRNLFKHTNYDNPPGQVINFPTHREVKVAEGDGSELRFIRMAYYAYTSYQGGGSGVSGLAFNEFNHKALQLMKPGDMVAFKMYEVVCKRR